MVIIHPLPENELSQIDISALPVTNAVLVQNHGRLIDDLRDARISQAAMKATRSFISK